MHGTVMGGGLEIALACHYRIAAPTTRFALPEVTLGIIPGAGGTQRLPRLIGAERALDFILSAKPIGAEQAMELGFLDEIIEGDLKAGAMRLRARVACRRQGSAPHGRDKRRSRDGDGRDLPAAHRARAKALSQSQRGPGGRGGRAQRRTIQPRGRTRVRNRARQRMQDKRRVARRGPCVLRGTRQPPRAGAGRRNSRGAGQIGRGRRRRHHGWRHRDLLRECRHTGDAARCGRRPRSSAGSPMSSAPINPWWIAAGSRRRRRRSAWR